MKASNNRNAMSNKEEILKVDTIDRHARFIEYIDKTSNRIVERADLLEKQFDDLKAHFERTVTTFSILLEATINRPTKKRRK
jgi:hypothetical protein